MFQNNLANKKKKNSQINNFAILYLHYTHNFLHIKFLFKKIITLSMNAANWVILDIISAY